MKKTALILVVISIITLIFLGWFVYDWPVSEKASEETEIESEMPIDIEKVSETNENYNREFVAKDVGVMFQLLL